jgi:signal transduction histidine kinase/ActR/RegA family two-component response regulator/HAMP domain-containing protein
MRLQSKIALSVLPLVVLAVLAEGLVAMKVADQALRETNSEHMSVVLDLFIQNNIRPLHALLEQHGLTQVDSFVADYQKQVAESARNFSVVPSGHIFAMDPEGRLKFCSRDHPAEELEPIWGPLARSIAAVPGEAATSGTNDGFEHPFFYTARRFPPWDWTVFYAVSGEEFEALVRPIRLGAIGTALVGGLALLLFIFLVLRRVLIRPVSALQRAASDIAQGGDVETIPLQSRDELGALARHMEVMAAGIRAHRRMEETWRRELESEVRRRTEALQKANNALTLEIDQRNQAQAELRQSEDRYRLLFDTILHGFLLVERSRGENGGESPGYRILEVNPAFETMTALEKKEWTGRRLDEAFPDMDGDWHDRLAEVSESGRSIRFETYLPSLDRHLDVVAFRPRADRVALLFSDLTPGKRLEAQLRQAQKMESIGTLAGGIAHDFNNILFPIMGYAEMAREEIPGDSGPGAYIEEILRATGRARDLVNQILTFSRQTEQEIRPLQIQPILKEALHLLRASIPSSIEIRRHIDAHCGAVQGDPSQIHQIVMNLCTNAYHAMQPDGGRLGVGLEEVDISAADAGKNLNLSPGRYVRLTVSDTGGGISPADRERIFEPYFTTKEQGKGTGLGLSVVHGIARRSGGTVTVYSEVGKGATFHVFLPRVATGAAAFAGVDQPLPTGDERILVVDDEAPITGMLEQMLTRLGYAVAVSADSQAALNLFRKQPERFDLVLTDMTMPGLNGVQLTRALLELRPDLPVILCTGFSESVSEEEARAAGVRAYLMKPVVRSQLARAIRRALESEPETLLSKFA